MMVIGEWSSCPYLDPQAFRFIFSPPVPLRRGSDRAALVGTWHPARVNAPQHGKGYKSSSAFTQSLTEYSAGAGHWSQLMTLITEPTRDHYKWLKRSLNVKINLLFQMRWQQTKIQMTGSRHWMPSNRHWIPGKLKAYHSCASHCSDPITLQWWIV